MKKSIVFIFFTTLSFTFQSCSPSSETKSDPIQEYIPANKTLYDEIVAMDSLFFNAYNTCDMEKQAFIYADQIEFFHDQGGLMTSKEELLEATKNNICGKVTRELVKGSIEVYGINNYGAVQMGLHKFHNNQEPNAESTPSKFIAIWNNVETGDWKMKKVISLH
ncbi:MAG: nuclear transport factor 2 family protein [Saprospiraceae bacterium]|nr:nuclear transport factor 2 family protein [Saprospiraceae bacterium]